jgi:lysozyme
MFNFNSQHPVVRAAKQPASWIVIAVTCVSLFEGFASKPYVDRVGTGQPITWCYGETKSDHPVPAMGTTFTKAECQAILATDLPKYDAQIQKCLTPATYAGLPPYRHAALVSFTYNVGGGAFCKSSIVKYLNAGNPTAACNAMLQYNRGGGKVLQGLVNRRNTERTMCLRSD